MTFLVNMIVLNRVWVRVRVGNRVHQQAKHIILKVTLDTPRTDFGVGPLNYGKETFKVIGALDSVGTMV